MQRDCGAWVILLAHKLKKHLNAALTDLGMTGVQSRVMHYILEHSKEGPVFQRDVEHAFGLSRSSTTGVLQLMEKNGLIVRQTGADDARLKQLVPTDRAVQLDAEVGVHLREMAAVMRRGISDGQLQIFLETAEKMADNLDELTQ